MQPTWSVINLLTENIFGYDNVVTGIFYLITYEDRTSTGFVVVEIGDYFIEYSLLTEEIVLGWLFNKIDKQALEDSLVNALPATPTIQLPNLPWYFNFQSE